MFEQYNDKEQLERINSVLMILKKENKDLEDIDIGYLKQYLSEDDIITFYKMLAEHFYNKSRKCKLYKTSITPKKQNLQNNNLTLKWEEINPYTILGIEEKEYNKDELLEIVGNKIKLIKKNINDNSKINNKIDKVLDAYNEIIKTSHKQKQKTTAR